MIVFAIRGAVIFLRAVYRDIGERADQFDHRRGETRQVRAVIVVGAFFVRPENWSPFAPMGWTG